MKIITFFKSKLKRLNYELLLIVVIIIFFFTGIIVRLLWKDLGNYTFLIENMIWFPIELLITLFAINKIIERIQTKKDREKFKKVTRRANDLLISILKRKIVSIVIDTNTHDPDRDELKIYDDVIRSTDKYLNESLFRSSRRYLYSLNNYKNYNIMGILMVECGAIDTQLKEYINRYSAFFDEELYEKISVLEQINYYRAGHLNIKTEQGKIADQYQFGGSFESLKRDLNDLIEQTNEVIKKIESY